MLRIINVEQILIYFMCTIILRTHPFGEIWKVTVLDNGYQQKKKHDEHNINSKIRFDL